jgi:hypothetical protein
MVFVLRLSAGPPTEDLEETQIPFAIHTHLLPSDDGLKMGPKRVEAS